MNINIAICDDSGPFVRTLRTKIEDYCSRMDIACQIEPFTSPTQMLGSDLSLTQCLFLDIDMPTMNGIEAARRLRSSYPDLIIVYVTAWIQYAPHGYEVAAFRYLLKQDLEKELDPCMDAILGKLDQETGAITLLGAQGPFAVPLRHILYFEAAPNRKVYLHQTGLGTSPIECHSTTLSQLEEELKNDGFQRIQRSFLVDLRHVKHIHNYTVDLTSGEALKVSRNLYDALKQEYAFWRIKEL